MGLSKRRPAAGALGTPASATRPHLCVVGGAGGRRPRGAQAGGGCHSRTHAGGMQTAGLPCGHVSAPPTEVGAQVPSLWALGARQAADERRCRLTLSWPHPSLPPAAGWSSNRKGQETRARLGALANEWVASGLTSFGSRANTAKRQDSG